MTDHDFQNRIFEALSGIESRLEKRLDIIEAQRKADSERLEKRLDSLDTRLDSLNSRLGSVEQNVGWIKGKLEGKQEGTGRMLTVFTTGAAIAAVIIALIALFN
ncbi:hypothetical protein C6496_21450 [Candidatus Poribacteria bacterium]|nr:MAG: hypothetical protein C6496_21450 [Candidatus Poribacteria bacterium]